MASNEDQIKSCVCVVCFNSTTSLAKEVGKAHCCSSCSNYVHVFCGEGKKQEEGYGQNITCSNCIKRKKSKFYFL